MKNLVHQTCTLVLFCRPSWLQVFFVLGNHQRYWKIQRHQISSGYQQRRVKKTIKFSSECFPGKLQISGKIESRDEVAVFKSRKKFKYDIYHEKDRLTAATQQCPIGNVETSINGQHLCKNWCVLVDFPSDL